MTWPTLTYRYLCDFAYSPYGDKSFADLSKRVTWLFTSLPPHSFDLCIVACNTASTQILELLRKLLATPVIGVVPGIKPASEQSKTRVFGVLATPATIRGSYLKNLIDHHGQDCHILQHGSLALVRMAEAKLSGEPIDHALVEKEAKALSQQPLGEQMDIVVLGCTHFPFLVDELTKFLPKVDFYDPAFAIAKRLGSFLPIPPPHKQDSRDVWSTTNLSKQQIKIFRQWGFDKFHTLERGHRG